MEIKTEINESAVKEIARMQRLIDTYETAITCFFLMTKNKDISMLRYNTPLDKEINEVYKWIKKKRKEEE